MIHETCRTNKINSSCSHFMHINFRNSVLIWFIFVGLAVICLVVGAISLVHRFALLISSKGFSKILNSVHCRAARKLPSQLVAPPRLNRSISTPAKYAFSGMPMSGGVRLPMSGSALPTSLDENPFFKMSEGATGFMPLTVSASIIKKQLHNHLMK